MDSSFLQNSIQVSLQNDPHDINSSEISQLRKGDLARRQLLDLNNDEMLKNLNNRRDSIFTLTNNNNNDDIIKKPLHSNLCVSSFDKQKLLQNSIQQKLLGKQQLPSSLNNQTQDATKFLKRTNNVKKFIKLLYENTPQLNYKKLQKNHLSYINDKSFRRILDHKKKCSLISFKSCKKFFKIRVFKPDSKIMIIWETLVLILAIFFVWISTIELSQKRIFVDEIPNLQSVYIIIIIIFSIDIILNLNIGYFDGFTLIEDNIKIIQNYFRHHFLIDTLPIIGYYITYFTSIQIFQFTSIFRIFKMISLINKIQENFHFQEKYPTATTLTKLLLLIFFVAHMCGCGFVYIANLQSRSVDNWIDKQNLNYSQFYEQYIVALYYAFITMITVGYGDVVPVTIEERIYTIFMTLIACGIFAYSVNQIGQIVSQIEQTNAEQKKQKYEILNYMEGRNIKKEIQQKIFQYFQQLAQIEMQSNTKGMLVLNKLPINLKNEIFQDFYGKLLKEQNFFTKNFCPELLEQLALKMQESVIGPGQIIYSKNQVDRKLYIISHGEIQFFDVINKQEKSFGTMGKSVMIGLPGFLTGQSRLHGTKSVNIAHVVSLDYQDFLDTIVLFPKDYVISLSVILIFECNNLQQEKFCMIRDSYIQNHYKITTFCTFCKNNTHYTLKCPFVFYCPNKQLIISKNNFSLFQKRLSYSNRRKHKIRVLQDLANIKSSLKQLRVNLIIDQGQGLDLNNSFEDLINNFGYETDKEFYRSAPIYVCPGSNPADLECSLSFNTFEDNDDYVDEEEEEGQQYTKNTDDDKNANINNLTKHLEKNQKLELSQHEQDVQSSFKSSKISEDEKSEEKNNLRVKSMTKLSHQQYNEDVQQVNSISSLQQFLDEDNSVKSKSIKKQQSQRKSRELSLKTAQEAKSVQSGNGSTLVIQNQIVQFQKIVQRQIRKSLKAIQQFKDPDKQGGVGGINSGGGVMAGTATGGRSRKDHGKDQNFSDSKSLIQQQQQLQNSVHHTNQCRSSINSSSAKQQVQQIAAINELVHNLETKFSKQINKLINLNINNNNQSIKQMKTQLSLTKVNQHDDINQDFFTIKNFDKMHKFIIYYPQFNYSNLSKMQNKKKSVRSNKKKKTTHIFPQNNKNNQFSTFKNM